MTDNPREQLVEIGAAALLRRFSPAPDEDVTFDSAEWFQIARLDAADILDAVLSERELVIAALGGEKVGSVCVYHGRLRDGTLSDFGLRCHNPLDCERVPTYAFTRSSVGERP